MPAGGNQRTCQPCRNAGRGAEKGISHQDSGRAREFRSNFPFADDALGTTLNNHRSEPAPASCARGHSIMRNYDEVRAAQETHWQRR